MSAQPITIGASPGAAPVIPQIKAGVASETIEQTLPGLPRPDASVVVAVLDNDSDDDGWLLLLAPSADDPGPTAKGGIWFASGEDAVTFVPKAGFSGVDTFDYEAIDQDGQSCQATVTIDVAELATVTTVTTAPAELPKTGSSGRGTILATALVLAGWALVWSSRRCMTR